MKKKTGGIEILKNVLIVVLTLSAIFLVTFYWEAIDYESLFSKEITEDDPIQVVDAPKAKELIFPSTIAIYNEKTNSVRYLNAKGDAWQQILASFNAFSKNGTPGLEETHAEIIEDSKKATYIEIDFGYNLPFDGFCKQFGIASQPFSDIQKMQKIYYFENIPESLFLVDGEEEKYYRLTGENEALSEIRSLLESGEEEETNPVIYTLAKEENEERRDLIADKYAKTFFDNSFDFVRRVEDSKGTLTFMYGYSQKVLMITEDGTIEYKAELETASITQGFYASLGTALSYVAEHFGWYPDVEADGEVATFEIKPYLVSGETIVQKPRTGYRYTFGYAIDNPELQIGEDDLITVEVFDGQVTYYKRLFYDTIELVRE